MKKGITLLAALLALMVLLSTNTYAVDDVEATAVLSVGAPLSAAQLDSLGSVQHLMISGGRLTAEDFSLIRDRLSSMLVTLDLSAASLAENTLPEYALAKMTVLESVEFPVTMKAVERGALYGCENLREVVLPPATRKIGWGAFAGCTRLNTIRFLGDAVELPYYNNAGLRAFYGCALDLSDFAGDYPMIDQADLLHFGEQRPAPFLRLSKTKETIRPGEKWSPPDCRVQTRSGGDYNALVASGAPWMAEGIPSVTVREQRYRCTDQGGRVPITEGFGNASGIYCIDYILSDDRLAPDHIATFTLEVLADETSESSKPDDETSKPESSKPEASDGGASGSGAERPGASSKSGGRSGGSDQRDTDPVRTPDTPKNAAKIIEDAGIPLTSPPNENANPATGR